ncbi:MAG: hypothetical protein Kow0090_09120 [Myxococcota bacterium]
MHSLKNDALIRSLSAVCGNSLFEIAHIEHIEMAYIAPYLNSRIKSLTLHEQPSIRESSTLALRRGAELRSAIGQFVRWKLAEPYYLSQFHKIFVFTKEELGGLHMPELFKTEIVLLPAPAEVPQRKSLEKRYDMFFLGNYGHRPNLDALEFITGGMLPLFASLPSPPTVAVAGNNAPGYLEELEKKYPFFKCLGYVEDAASAISAARLFVAPILSGGGVRMKNLSALASATPVLTTERGGWGVLVGRGGVVIEKPTHKRFVNTAMKLLNDPVALDKFAKEAEITALNQNKLFQEFNYYPNLR